MSKTTEGAFFTDVEKFIMSLLVDHFALLVITLISLVFFITWFLLSLVMKDTVSSGVIAFLIVFTISIIYTFYALGDGVSEDIAELDSRFE